MAADAAVDDDDDDMVVVVLILLLIEHDVGCWSRSSVFCGPAASMY
jgi:hypothetical protein